MGIHAGNRSRPAYSGQARFEFPVEVKLLFKPRPALPHALPVRARRRSRLRPMTGIASFIHHFESRDEYLGREKTAAAALRVTPARKREVARVEAAERVTRRVAKVAAQWERSKQGDPAAKTGDPFCTLFVWHLSKSTGISTLCADFGTFGRVVRVSIPRDRRGLARGYAFVEFANERDLKSSVTGARGRLIDGRRVRVDVERGRTVRGFLPNRLDGPFNSASTEARRILGGKSTVAEEARRRLLEGKPKISIPVYLPPSSPKTVSPSRDHVPGDVDFRGSSRSFGSGGNGFHRGGQNRQNFGRPGFGAAQRGMSGPDGFTRRGNWGQDSREYNNGNFRGGGRH